MIFLYLDMAPDKLCDLQWKAKILEKLLSNFVMISWKDDSKIQILKMYHHLSQEWSHYKS